MVGLEGMLDYGGVRLQRLHCTCVGTFQRGLECMHCIRMYVEMYCIRMYVEMYCIRMYREMYCI